MRTERTEKIKKALADTRTTFVPSQLSSTDQIKQLIEIANLVGLYDAADVLTKSLPTPKTEIVAALKKLD